MGLCQQLHSKQLLLSFTAVEEDRSEPEKKKSKPGTGSYPTSVLNRMCVFFAPQPQAWDRASECIFLTGCCQTQALRDKYVVQVSVFRIPVFASGVNGPKERGCNCQCWGVPVQETRTETPVGIN